MTTECLGCNAIESHPVTLADGRVVCSSCEAWRAETEARHVAAMDTHAERADYLDKVRAKRGEDAARALRVAAWMLMQKQGA